MTSGQQPQPGKFLQAKSDILTFSETAEDCIADNLSGKMPVDAETVVLMAKLIAGNLSGQSWSCRPSDTVADFSMLFRVRITLSAAFD